MSINRNGRWFPRRHPWRGNAYLAIAVIALVLAGLLAWAASAAYGQDAPGCAPGVGYRPARFAGRPCIDQPLDNLTALHNYVVRYGQTPGWPSGMPDDATRTAYEARYGPTPWDSLVGKRYPGWCCELSGLNDSALEAAAQAGNTGPGGEPLHPGTPSITESTDLRMVEPAGGSYVFRWVVSSQDGAAPEHPVHLNQPTGQCGPYTVSRGILRSYTLYAVNDPPCGAQPPPSPAPTPTPIPSPTPPPAPAYVLVPADLLESWIVAAGWTGNIGPARHGRLARGAAYLRAHPLVYVPSQRTTGQVATSIGGEQ